MKLTKLNENKTLAEYEKEWEEHNGKTCDKCGTKLNDGGTCPKCDDGEEDSLKEGVSGTNSEEFDSYAAAIERHKSNGNEKELDSVITSAYNDLNRETRLTGPEFNKLCDLANLPNRKIKVRGTNENFNEDFKTKQFEIEGFDKEVVDEFEDGGHTGYNIVYSKNGTDLVEVEVWETPSPVTVNANLYIRNMMGHFYSSFEEFAMDLEYKCERYLKESLNEEDDIATNVNRWLTSNGFPDGKESSEDSGALSDDEREELYAYIRNTFSSGDIDVDNLPVDDTIATKLDNWLTKNGFPNDDKSSDISSVLSADEEKELYSYIRNMLASEEESKNESLGVGAGLAIGGADSMPLTASLDRDKEEKRTRHYGKDYDDEFTLMGY